MRKTILVSVAALALMAAPALAQGEHHDHAGGGNGGEASHASGGNGGGAPHASSGGNGGGAPHASGGGGAPHAMTQSHPDRNPDHGNMGGAGPSRQTSAPAVSGPSQGNAAMMQGGGEHHGDRGNGNRGGGNNNFNNNNNNNNAMRGPTHNFGQGGGDRQRAANFNSYHRNFTAPQRYRAPRYRRPQGWYAHRWTYGERLPPAFFIRDYWLSDYFDFGLVAPPYGATWVRYGSDALLIDEETGEVIQVAYGVFY